MTEYLKPSEQRTPNIYDDIQLDKLPAKDEGSKSATSRNMESANENKLTVKQVMFIIFITCFFVIVAFICGFLAAYLGFKNIENRTDQSTPAARNREEGASTTRRPEEHVPASATSAGQSSTPSNDFAAASTARPPARNDAEQMSSGGSTYVRWGRSTCPQNGTSMTYSGVAGGQYYSNTGGSSNYVCLPLDPQWGNYNDGNQNSGWIQGAEYEIDTYNPFEGISTEYVTNLHDQTVPCTVCATKRSMTIMIPARKVCYDGWTLEYRGYLMSERASHQRTEYVCVDAKPEAHGSGQANQNGALFYPVQGDCGHTLPCPPYVMGRELTCVVCSK